MSTQDASKTSSPLFLGLDLSTQQLKVIALQCAINQDGHSTTLETHSTFAVQFDADLAHYHTQGGVTVEDDTRDRGVVTAPVLMWVEALELVLDRMKQAAFPFERVHAISGAAQQHGSVYWSHQSQEAFRIMQSSASTSNETHSLSLVEIFQDAFTVGQSPIWQDTSTTAQCQEIEEFLGSLDSESGSERTSIRLRGQQRLADLTGSLAYERYTGSQILKIVQTKPEVYRATERISLVSSFLASLLMAQYALIDVADGSGMNLLDIDTKAWDSRLTEFISRGGVCHQDHGGSEDKDTLSTKLGDVDVSGKKAQGVLSKWFVQRYGFRSDVNIVSFTGDNPATVMAMHAEQGDAIVSLGTSDTLLLYTNKHRSNTEVTEENETNQSNARLSIGYLCHPVDPSGYLMMYCAKNGSLAREKIRDQYADGDWDQFNRYLKDAATSDHGTKSRIGFYFFDREIWPPVQGMYRFEDGIAVNEFEDENDGDTKQWVNVLAICESQFLAIRIRSSQGDSLSASSSKNPSLSPPGVSRILATGGASSNRAILQLLSNVFGVPVVSKTQNEQKGAGSAAWGAARKAFLFGRHDDRDPSVQYHQEEEEEKVDSNMDVDDKGAGGKSGESATVWPDLEQTRKYVEMIPEFVRLERILLQKAD